MNTLIYSNRLGKLNFIKRDRGKLMLNFPNGMKNSRYKGFEDIFEMALIEVFLSRYESLSTLKH